MADKTRQRSRRKKKGKRGRGEGSHGQSRARRRGERGAAAESEIGRKRGGAGPGLAGCLVLLSVEGIGSIKSQVEITWGSPSYPYPTS